MTSLAAALEARPAASEDRIGYREHIRHPSLTEPVTAHGWFERAADGTLVRHQTAPQEETVQIGERFLRLHREADDYSNIMPIPSELAPYLRILRALVTDDHDGLAGLLESFDARLVSDQAGWRASLSAAVGDDGAQHLMLTGCGERLRSVEWQLPDGTSRRYRFTTVP